MPSSDRAGVRTRAVAIGLCAFAYLYVFPWQVELNNPNENVRFYMTAAIVENGSYEITPLRARWGWVNDAGVREGRVYSVKAPGASFVGVPGYAIYYGVQQLRGAPVDFGWALWWCRLVGSILPSLVFLWFFHAWLTRRVQDPVLSNAAFFAVALGSNFFAYALMFASHAQCAACGFGALMVLSDGRAAGRTSMRAAFVAGLLAAGVTLFEYPGILGSLPLSLYAVYALYQGSARSWLGRLAAYGVGGAIPALAMMHFQWVCFGSPFSPGHLFVENEAFRAGHQEGFFGAKEFHWEGAWKLLVHPYYGLFSLTPFLVFAGIGLFVLIRRRGMRAEAWTTLVVSAVLYVAICFMNIWHAGWSVGPRYLTLLFPFLAWASAVGLVRIAKWNVELARLLAVGTCAASVVASGAPSIYYPFPPPDLAYPLAQLYGLCVTHGFAPLNGGRALGLVGTASMLPMFACGLAAVALVSRAHEALWRSAARLGAGLGLGALVLAPICLAPERDAATTTAIAFVTRTWTPKRENLADRQADALEADPAHATPDAWRAVGALYLEEGRADEADAAARHADAVARAH